jgi:hypothetical protein
VAARAQENRGIRSSDACGEISVPSTEWCGRIILPNLEAIWEMSTNTSQAQKIGLICASIVVTFLVLEFGVRLVRGKIFDTTLLSAGYGPVEEVKQAPRAQYDEFLGWVPNYGKRIGQEKRNRERRAPPATYTIIDGNVRSGGPDDLNSKASKTVLAMGDSFTFGEDVNDHETWPAQLEKFLGQKVVNGKIISHRVINGGVFNYGLDQIILRSERLVEKYKPDLLLVSIIPDDIVRCEMSVRMEPKPYFILNNGQLVLKNNPVPLSDGNERPKQLDLFRRYFGYSHLVDLVMRRINVYYWLNERIVLAERNQNKSIRNSSGEQISCALMERLSHLSKEHSLPTILVLQYSQYLKEKDIQKSREVLKCARKHGLKVLDLYNPLNRSKLNNPEQFYGLFVHHMTAKGNEFVAQHIYQFIREQRLLN